MCTCMKSISLLFVAFFTSLSLSLSPCRLQSLDPPILLGRVGVPDQLEVAKRFGVGGYPLLIVFRHGKQYNYTGTKDEEGELVMVVTNTCWTLSMLLWYTSTQYSKFKADIGGYRILHFGNPQKYQALVSEKYCHLTITVQII